MSKKKLTPLASAAALAGCDPKPAKFVPPSPDSLIVEPVGKYHTWSDKWGNVFKSDTQSGQLWVLLPPRCNANPSDQFVWRELPLTQ